MATKKQIFARERNWKRRQLMGIRAVLSNMERDTKYFSDRESRVITQCSFLLGPLVINWTEQTKILKQKQGIN